MASKSDFFARFLSDKIRKYDAFGIWMHAHADLGGDDHHICNILAIGIDNFNLEMIDSNLSSVRTGLQMPRMLYQKWPNILGLTIQQETIIPDINGIKTKINMFRFFEPNSVDMHDMVRPNTPDAEAAPQKYYCSIILQNGSLAEDEILARIYMEEDDGIINQAGIEQVEELFHDSAGEMFEGDCATGTTATMADESAADLKSLLFAQPKCIQDDIVKLYFPRHHQTGPTYEHFLRNISKKALSEFLIYVCHDLALGVTYWSRLLRALDADAWAKGISDNILTGEALLSPEQTYAAQIYTNSTDRQRIKWAAVIKEQVGVPVSSKNEKLQLIFDLFNENRVILIRFLQATRKFVKSASQFPSFMHHLMLVFLLFGAQTKNSLVKDINLCCRTLRKTLAKLRCLK